MKNGSRLAASLILPLLLGTTAAVPSNDVREVHQGYDAIARDFYRPLSPEQILRGVRESVASAIRRSDAKASVALPPVPHGIGDRSAGAYLDGLLAAAGGRSKLSGAALAHAALDGMAKSAGDRYTVFFDTRQYGDFLRPLNPDAIAGIGVLTAISEDGYAQAFFVEPDTPADRAGIQSGDSVLAIDGRSTHGWSVAQIVQSLRGLPKTDVRVRVRHGSEAKDLVITRAEVHAPTVYFKLLKPSAGYLFVSAFGAPTSDEFARALDRLKSQGATSYVIDLRYDGGGYVGAAVDMASEFLTREPIVSVQARDGEIRTVYGDGAESGARTPVAILVNGYTASAAEIMTAALQENHAATVVGSKTFGKGVIQTMTRFPDGTALKITTARYLTPQGHDINHRGIVPDIAVDSKRGDVLGDPARDPQLREALRSLGVTPQDA